MGKDPKKESIQRWRYVASDFVAGMIAFFIFNIYRCVLLRSSDNVWEYVFSSKLVAEELSLPFVMLGIYWMSGFYNRPFGKSRLQEFITTFNSSLIVTAVVYLVLLINDQTGERFINYELIAMLAVLVFAFTYAGRVALTQHALRYFKTHRWEIKTLIIGNSSEARGVGEKLEKESQRFGYRIVGYVGIPGENRKDSGYDAYRFEDIKGLCEKGKVDNIIIVPRHFDEMEILHVLYDLFPLNVPIKIAPDTMSYMTSSIRMKDIYGEPFMDLTSPGISESSKNIKRVGDVILSSVLLVVLSPLFAMIALLVKMSGPGRIIYSQERIGLKQHAFRIYKFRTMKENAEADGPQLSKSDDDRVTKIGRFLRKYRLDELPQFWNVVKGDMSIVGPRPERSYFIEQIVKKAPYYVLVYQVRPGITSWGMVKYGYASSVAEMVERTKYDLIYMANMSLLVDMKIMIYTVKTIVTGRGI